MSNVVPRARVKVSQINHIVVVGPRPRPAMYECQVELLWYLLHSSIRSISNMLTIIDSFQMNELEA